MPSKKFADKYLLAVEQAIKEKPQGGLNGFEQEWNLLDEDLRPPHVEAVDDASQRAVGVLRACDDE